MVEVEGEGQVDVPRFSRRDSRSFQGRGAFACCLRDIMALSGYHVNP